MVSTADPSGQLSPRSALSGREPFQFLEGDLGALRFGLRRGYDPQIPDGTGIRSARDPRGSHSQIERTSH